MRDRDENLEIFYKSGLALAGETKQTASVMISYSVGIDKDGNAILGEKVETSYNHGKIDLLRKDKNYDGVICTDWMVTSEMAWGKEASSVEERHFEIIKAGSDMFGGNNEVAPVLAAYDMWEKEYKAGNLEISVEDRWTQSVTRVLKLVFQTNMYENPYLVLEDSQVAVESKDKVDAGYQAQLDSIVMLKK